MEDISYYSEEKYYRKSEINQLYQAPANHCLWDEIVKYRKQYIHSFQFSNKNTYITLNASLYHKLVLLYEIGVEDYQHPAFANYINYIPYGFSTILSMYLTQNHLECDPLLYQFLISDEILFLKVFILFWKVKNNDLLYLLLISHHKSGYYPIIQRFQYHEKEENDYTYVFREFLDDLYYQTQQNKKEPIRHLKEDTIEENLLRYPKLTRMMLSFYYEHAKEHYYYTIAHYQDYANVSYESARKAFDLLCQYHFYQKQKIGKKYVYSVVK